MDRLFKFLLALCLLSVLGLACASPALLYRTSALQTLPGTGQRWGFAALQPDSSTLFIARRENGLTLFDVETQRAGATLANSAGANAVAFVPRYNRAYVANMDGTLGIIALDNRKVLKRLKLDDGNLNNLLYDRYSNRLIVTSGRRGDHSTLYFIDPASDRLVGQRDLPARKLDGPIGLSDGTFIVPWRDENQIALLSGPALANQRLLGFAGCRQPSALAADEKASRLFIACRGTEPQLVVADLASGAAIATLPISHAVNTMAFDEQSKQLVIASGTDANLTVIGQDEAGHYQVLGSVGTRPWAHNMVLDSRRQRVYLLTMDFTQPAPSMQAPKADPIFHPDTFTVMTLQAQ